MKTSVVLLLFLSFLSIEVSAQTYGLDNADPSVFSRFRIPETDLSSLWFNTNLSFLATKATSQINGEVSSASFNYSLSPQYYLLKESDDRYLSLNAGAYGSYYHNHYESEQTGASTSTYSNSNSNTLDLAMNEVYRDYGSTNDFFYSINSTGQLAIASQYNDQPISDSTRRTFYDGEKAQNYTFSIGFGWGKMRNVTSVVSAIRFQERLKQISLLNHDLDEKTIEDLANQFYRQGYYSSVHVRPDKYFWDDVEKTLSDDSVSLAGLNQYADSYIREVPGELRFSRNEGVVVGVDLQVSYINNYGSTNNPSISEQLYTLGNAYLDYSHQLDLNSQVNFDISFSGGPSLTKSSIVKQEYVFSADAGYDYELTDRIVTSIYNTFGLNFYNQEPQAKRLSNELSFQLNYFVEDNLSLTGSYTWNYTASKYMSLPDRETQDHNSIQIGFTYYFERGLLYK